jgi:hypothetical protein
MEIRRGNRLAAEQTPATGRRGAHQERRRQMDVWSASGPRWSRRIVALIAVALAALVAASAAAPG